MSTLEDNNSLGMYVTIHAQEFPELHAHLSSIANKQIRSRVFKKIASESLRGISTNTVLTLKPAVVVDAETTNPAVPIVKERTEKVKIDGNEDYPPITQNLADAGFKLG
jgi:hypothetical protein